MRLEIRLESGSLDLPPNAATQFYVTKQIHDLHDLETREGSFTRSITLPKTSFNKQLLGASLPEHVPHGGAISLTPCQVLIDGVPVLENPLLRVEKNNARNFEITIFSGVVGFFNQLPDRGINELGFGGEDMDFSLAGIFNHTSQLDGAVFPGDFAWYENQTLRDLRENNFTLPEWGLEQVDLSRAGFCYYIETILQKIYNNTEYHVDASPLRAGDPVPFTGILNSGGLINVTGGNSAGLANGQELFFEFIGPDYQSQQTRVSSIPDGTSVVLEVPYTANIVAANNRPINIQTGATPWAKDTIAAPVPLFLERSATDAESFYGSAAGANIIFDSLVTPTFVRIPLTAAIERGISYVTNAFVVPSTGQLLSRVDVRISYPPVRRVQPNQEFYIGLEVNGTVVERYTIIPRIDTPGGTPSPPSGATFGFSFNGQVSANDQVALVYFFNYERNSSATIIFAAANLVVNRQGGSDSVVNPGDWMPDTGQAEFLKSIFQLYHIVLTESNKVVTLRYWEEIKSSAPLEIEEDTSRPITESGIFAGYGRRNVFKYTLSDLIERTDTEGEYGTQVGGIAAEVEVITSILSPSDVSALREGASTPPPHAGIPAFTFERLADQGISFTAPNVYQTVESNQLRVGDLIKAAALPQKNPGGARIARVASIIDNRNGFLDITDAPTLAPPGQAYEYFRYASLTPPPLQLVSMAAPGRSSLALRNGGNVASMNTTFFRGQYETRLNWGSLLSSFYATLMAATARPYTLQVYVRMSITDFAGFDQLTPFYLKSRGARFYVNLIEQYRPGQPVRVDLLRIGSTELSTLESDENILDLGAFSEAFDDAFYNGSD